MKRALLISGYAAGLAALTFWLAGRRIRTAYDYITGGRP